MKKTLKHILALVIILPFLFAGCQKSETIEEEKFTDTGFHKDLPILCGEEYVANLVDFDETFTAGTLTVGNDENNFYAYFQVAPGYQIYKSALYVGPVSGIPGESFDPSTQTGVFYFDQLTYYMEHNPMVTEYQTPPHGLNLLEECFAVVGIVEVVNLATGEYTRVSAKSNSKTHAFYFEYCKQECNIPEPTCETAYAYGEDFATCFLNIPGVKSNNWGWSNGPISQGSDLTWDIYAGAGQCDITKGTLVGTLDVKYVDGTCTVTYNIDPDFTLDETHLYVGNDILAKKKNKYTTAPGQFPLSGGDSFTINNLEGDIYVVAHSVVCGDYDE